MVNILEILGVDEGDVEWHHLAACRGMPTNLYNIFFDDYETDRVVAEQADNMCLACPVIKYCGGYGVATKSTGVFGGVYLNNGKADKKFNAHKTSETWKRLEALYV